MSVLAPPSVTTLAFSISPNSSQAEEQLLSQRFNTWTSNCKVFIQLNGTPEQDKVLVLRNIEELDKYQRSSQSRLEGMMIKYNTPPWLSLKELLHLHLETIRIELKGLEHDIDLDHDFFSNINHSGCYYLEEQYHQTVKQQMVNNSLQ